MSGMTFPKPDYATTTCKLVGYSDQGGRCDGVQIMVHRATPISATSSRRASASSTCATRSNPKAVKYVAAPPNTWTLHLQAHDDLLLVIHNKDMFAQPELADEKNYYKGSVDHHASRKSPASATGRPAWPSTTSRSPTIPKQIGFMPVDGTGLHRLWYVGGRWAYASALLDGFSDYILITIDMADPKKPRLAGKYWLPGMNVAAGEKANWPTKNGRFGLHHAIIHDDIAYCSWRDACLAVVDVKDKANPKLIVHKTWAPPFGGGTHNALPLPDRNLLDRRRRDRARQSGGRVQADLGVRQPGQVQPDQHLDLPGAIGQGLSRRSAAISGRTTSTRTGRAASYSSELIFATYQNAGVRVYDIKDQFRPKEVAAFVPPPPTKWVDPRPNRPIVLHSADVFVDKNALCYVTDFSAGLYIVEYKG